MSQKVTMQYGRGTSRSTAGYTKSLLWENADPTSNYAGQAVLLDLNEYDYVEIWYVAAAAAQNYYPPACAPVGATASMDAWTSIATSGQAILHRHRTADVSTTGVTFSDCEQKRTNSTSASTTDNSGCIPAQIFGVRL